MDVVVHEHIGVQRAPAGEQGFAEQMEVAVPVVVIQKTGQSVVAALDDVLGDAGKVESRLPGHLSSIARATRSAAASPAARSRR